MDHQEEIDSCLAYTVLEDPEPWIGYPSTECLDAFLCGVRTRRDYVEPDGPEWRISGVLDEPAFYKQFVDATGRPTLTIRWATALAMTHHSYADGFSKLRTEALAWHRKYGLNEDHLKPIDLSGYARIGEPGPFWKSFASRPAMYIGNGAGWTLYCFLNGMKKGGDWLELATMPRLDEVFGGIQERSENAYGSPFAAFRVYEARSLLEWTSKSLRIRRDLDADR